jgi:hypothetical protein
MSRTLHKDLCTFITVLDEFLLESEIFQKGKTEIRILCSITFFSENLAAYEIMWKNTVQPGRRRLQYGACDPHTG